MTSKEPKLKEHDVLDLNCFSRWERLYYSIQ